MSFESELLRIKTAADDIKAAITQKGMTVPSSARISDLAPYIANMVDIAEIDDFGTDDIKRIEPIDKIVLVDSNGYIGSDLTPFFRINNNVTYYYGYAILQSNADFSGKNKGQVNFVTTLDDPLYTSGTVTLAGKTYNTTTFNGRTWMAENLNHEYEGLNTIGDSVSNTTYNGIYYGNDSNNSAYGLLYRWDAIEALTPSNGIIRIPGINGWHIPTREEWEELTTAVCWQSATTTKSATRLKSIDGWRVNGDGLYGFNARPYGYGTGNLLTVSGSSGKPYVIFDSYSGFGESTRFWTSSPTASNKIGEDAYAVEINGNGLHMKALNNLELCYIRLIKDY